MTVKWSDPPPPKRGGRAWLQRELEQLAGELRQCPNRWAEVVSEDGHHPGSYWQTRRDHLRRFGCEAVVRSIDGRKVLFARYIDPSEPEWPSGPMTRFLDQRSPLR